MIKENLAKIKAEIGEDVCLVAVSKTKPAQDILEAYTAGQRHFGENYVQELLLKQAELPKDICWHMIGHLQSNKVKQIAPFVHLIHGIDSFKLLKEVNKEAAKHNRVIDCLLQVHVAQEETKFGFDMQEIQALLQDGSLRELKNICIKGLMTMGSNTENMEQVKQEFLSVKTLFDECAKFQIPNLKCEIISMGMSGDYQLAMECGSNMVRVGSLIFGNRNYTN